jgi:hypothetical protein
MQITALVLDPAGQPNFRTINPAHPAAARLVVSARTDHAGTGGCSRRLNEPLLNKLTFPVNVVTPICPWPTRRNR